MNPADPEGRLTVDVLAQPLAAPTLVRDYLRAEGGADAFYHGRAGDPESYAAKAREVAARFTRSDREVAAAALRPLSEAARERLAQFVESGGAVVTTGQQTGLFTGPLYTIYKALSAVRLARDLESLLGQPVLPVFWVASEDHDWAEVNQASLATRREVRRVSIPTDPAAPLPMSELRLPTDVGIALDELAQVVSGEPFADDVLRTVRAAYAPGRTVASAFSELLGALLAPFDVYLADAADPALKRASVPVLERALVDSAALAEALRRRVQRLEASGYHAQVGGVERATLLFHQGPEGRERLDRRDDDLWPVPSGGRRAVREWRDALRADPARFSPNVLLRPVVESFVFPTLAYVGGSSELAYFAQAGALFEVFGIQPPVATPRASLLLVEAAARERLVELGLAEAELVRPRHELVTELAGRAVPRELREALARLEGVVVEASRALVDAAARVDAPLAGTLARLRNEMLLRVGESERRSVGAMRRREGAAIERLDHVLAVLRPEGVPQERVLNVLPFLARHGPGLLTRMLDAVPGLPPVRVSR